jgi:predicted secreted Zn-dependent protease
MRIVARLFLAFPLLFGAASDALAKVKVSEKTQYYPIEGRSGLDLGRAMLSGGKRTINLRHAIAATATEFRISDTDVKVENGRCVVRDLTVHLDIVYHYPKWAQKPRASRDVQRAWDAFYAELLVHERTHGRIARDYAQRLDRELRKVQGNVLVRCADFPQSAKRTFDGLLARLMREQAAFDQRENTKTSRISRLQTALFKAK